MPKEKSFYEFFFELAIFFKFIAPAEGRAFGYAKSQLII